MASANDYLEQAADYIGISGTDNIFNTWIWAIIAMTPTSTRGALLSRATWASMTSICRSARRHLQQA